MALEINPSTSYRLEAAKPLLLSDALEKYINNKGDRIKLFNDQELPQHCGHQL